MTKRLRWYLPKSDGSYGDPVWLKMPDYDHAYLCDLWEQLIRQPPGRNRRALFNELRLHLDLRALLPGGRFVGAPPPPSPVPPAYLRRSTPIINGSEIGSTLTEERADIQ